MSPAPYAIKWTETALKMAEAIPDRRVCGLIFARVSELATAPERMGKP